MSDPSSNSSLICHTLFNKKEASTETKTKLDFLSSIWDDDRIERLDVNKWNCIWWDNTFQGINATGDLAHVLGTMGTHINSCFTAIEKYHPTRYQQLQNFKYVKKGVIKDYPGKTDSTISHLQNKSSEVIESSIHRSSQRL